jgi:hypothetical protein
MANPPTFIEHAADLLGLVAPIQARAMFDAVLRAKASKAARSHTRRARPR